MLAARFGFANPAEGRIVGNLWKGGRCLRIACGYHRSMPDPTLIIWGLIAVAVVVLWPIRNWIRSRYDRDAPDDEDGD